MGFQPTIEGEILLKGFVIWKTKVRYMVVNLNINTGKEVVVYDYFTERGNMLTLNNVDSLVTSIKSKRNFKLPKLLAVKTGTPGGNIITKAILVVLFNKSN